MTDYTDYTGNGAYIRKTNEGDFLYRRVADIFFQHEV